MRPSGVRPVEPIEDPAQLFWRNSNTLIRHREPGRRTLANQGDFDFSPWSRIFHGIVHQVQQEFPQAQLVALHDGRLDGPHRDLHPVLLPQHGRLPLDVLDQRIKSHRERLNGDFAQIGARKEQ